MITRFCSSKRRSLITVNIAGLGGTREMNRIVGSKSVSRSMRFQNENVSSPKAMKREDLLSNVYGSVYKVS